jgi:hypothetical protein
MPSGHRHVSKLPISEVNDSFDHLGRCYLKGRAGDAANAILSAAGYNFRRILAWLRGLLCQILVAILRLGISQSALNPASSWTTNFMDD